MRRFMLLVFVACTALSVVFSLWPRQVGGFVAMFSQHTSVNRGVAVTVLAVLTALLVALVLADALLEKTGGDSLAEVRRNLGAYLAGLEPQGAGG